MPGDQVSRRRVLTGLGVTLLAAAGCSSRSVADPTTPTELPRIDPDVRIREGAAEAERTLVAAYAATIARHPELAERLAAPSTHHGEHVAALTETPPEPETTATPRSGAPSTATMTVPPDDSGAASGVPDDPLAAVAALAAAERAAAARSLDDLEVASPGLARLLASVGAAEAAHAALLGS